MKKIPLARKKQKKNTCSGMANDFELDLVPFVIKMPVKIKFEIWNLILYFVVIRYLVL